MQLIDFHVKGFRSLEDVGPIALGKPLVLIGHNDAGKSACLDSLQFLMGRVALRVEDRTLVANVPSDDEAPPPRVAMTSVTGRFSLSNTEQADLELGPQVHVRRIAEEGGAARHEYLTMVSTVVALRDLETSNLKTLSALTDQNGLSIVGDKRKLETFLEPLRALRDAAPTEESWALAPRALINRMPLLLAFSSTQQPDPEGQVRSVLNAAYEKIIAQNDVSDTLEKIEQQVCESLEDEAVDLCAHIQARCPELVDVTANPMVSFKGGLQSVSLTASISGNEHIGLRHAGAGRQQRITLAVWEWTSKLVDSASGTADVQDTIIVYDEPDTHLDYVRQRDFLDLMHLQCAKPNVQMIVATHSLNLVDRVDLSQIVSLKLVDNRTSKEVLLDNSHTGIDTFISDLTLSLGLRNSVLLNEACFLVVEGATEQLCFPRLFRIHHGFPLQSVGIALMACGGNNGALQVAKFLIDHGRKVHFLLDQDSATHPQTRKLFSADKLKAAGIPLECVHYVGAPNELEELFSDERWVAVANAIWVRNDGRAYVPADVSALRIDGKFSSALLEIFKTGSSTGPVSKEEMMLALVDTLKDKSDVPTQLAEKFQLIIESRTK